MEERICERCHCYFTLGPAAQRQCPDCGSEFVRKVRDEDRAGWLSGNPESDHGDGPDAVVIEHAVSGSADPYKIINEQFMKVCERLASPAPDDPPLFAFNPAPERREVIVRVPYHTVLSLLRFNVTSVDFVVVCKSLHIPADAVCRHVNVDYASRCFEFVVEHPSFDPVPEMMAAPMHPSWPMNWEVVPLKSPD